MYEFRKSVGVKAQRWEFVEKNPPRMYCGYSIHRTVEDAAAFVSEFLAEQRKAMTAPSERRRPLQGPFPMWIGEALYEELQKTKNGLFIDSTKL